jgi:hypothetical protein
VVEAMREAHHEGLTLFGPSGSRKYLNAAEWLRFVEAARRAPRCIALFCLMLGWTGGRISEVLALSPASIDLDSRVVKGRDLIDLSHAYAVFEKLDTARVVACSGKYLGASGLAISPAQAEERMFNKLRSNPFIADVRPLLSADEAEKFDEHAARASLAAVFVQFIKKLPGEPWARTKEYAEREKMPELA